MIEQVFGQLKKIAASGERCFVSVSADGSGIVWTKQDTVCSFENLEELVSGLAQATQPKESKSDEF